MKYVKNTIYIALALGAAALLISIAQAFVGGARLADTGGQGQACYPNKSCKSPYTCFQMQKDYICEVEIRPVIREGLNVCYTTLDENRQPQAKCFDNEPECIASFGAVLKTQTPVKAGCGWK